MVETFAAPKDLHRFRTKAVPGGQHHTPGDDRALGFVAPSYDFLRVDCALRAVADRRWIVRAERTCPGLGGEPKALLHAFIVSVH
jgi:hypothetical protein